MEKTLYIIRHGETDLNKKGIVQGKGVNSPLNEKGMKQAMLFYDVYKHVQFERIFTSTLLRTHQTVDKFIKSGIPWEQLEGLDEISWGIYEGKEQTTEVLEGFTALTQGWCNGDLDSCVAHGETPNQVKERQKLALEYILNAMPAHSAVLVCMHGRAMRLLLCLLLGIELSKMDEFPHTNTALYKVIYDGQKFEIIDFYNTEHLAKLDFD